MINGDTWTTGLIAGAAGLLGRAMAVAGRPEQRHFSWSLLWELPVAIGMGVVGQGLAEYAHLTGFAALAITVATGYLGPRVIDAGLIFVTRGKATL